LSDAYSGPGGLRFGIFDWLDDTRRDLAENVELRVAMLEYADQHGFFAYHLAEHHGTPLSTIASPNLFFMLVAQRTRRLRFGPMVYLLPAYHPVRLIEEIAVLDQLSGGRIELGVGRNASPYEAELYGLDMANSRAEAREALAILTQGLATGEINFEGEHYHLTGVKLLTRAVQKPYPPLWWPTVNLETIPWIAENNFSVFLQSLFISMETVGQHLHEYRRILAESNGKPGRINGHVDQPNHGFTIQIVVANTDEEAGRIAKEAHALFYDNFTYLWVQHGDAARHEARRDFDTYVNQGLLTYGSPETVRTQLQHYLDVTGANYLGCTFAFGSLQREQVLRSIHLFTEQVMPKLHRPSLLPAAEGR
jgi:alkanesulfonate monooxygenase SsuD/methylene tetrahydromethanopterin reductase-like flavin-dependent oxidoreductase (luciferase family)